MANTNRMERFTQRAQEALKESHAVAVERNSPFINARHLLIGLLRVPECFAYRALSNLGVTLENATAQLAPPNEQPPEATELAPSTKRALERSVGHANALKHNYVGTEHILLGLADEADLTETFANLKVTPDAIREEVKRQLGEGED